MFVAIAPFAVLLHNIATCIQSPLSAHSILTELELKDKPTRSKPVHIWPLHHLGVNSALLSPQVRVDMHFLPRLVVSLSPEQQIIYFHYSNTYNIL